MNARNQQINSRPWPRMRLLWAALGLTTVVTAQVGAATLNIAQEPFFNTSSAVVYPNLMFILDSSGSMGLDHVPDYLRDYSNSSPGDPMCFDNGDSISGTGDAAGLIVGNRRNCHIGDPPFMSPDVNLIYYNPDFRYFPGKNGAVTPAVSMATQSLNNVTQDPFGKQKNTQLTNANTGTTIDLTLNYPDRVWCNNTGKPVTDAACVQNINAYQYPDKTYRYAPGSGGTSASALSNGMPSALGRYKSGAPYYWRIIPTEYCADAALKNCVDWTSADADGKVGVVTYSDDRWCAAQTLDIAGCQLAKDNGHRYPAKCNGSACVAPGTGSLYPYPAKVRFCAQPPSANTDPLTDCQGAYNEASSPTRKIPSYTGYVIPSAGDYAVGTITVEEAVPGHQITSITVTGSAINQLTSTVTVAVGDTPESVATKIHAALSTATWNKSVSGRTVRLESKVINPSPTHNGYVIAIAGPAGGSGGIKATAKITVNAAGAGDFRLGVICVGWLSASGTKCDSVSGSGNDLGSRIAVQTDGNFDLSTVAGREGMAIAIKDSINNTANGGFSATVSGNEVLIEAPTIGGYTTPVAIMTASPNAGYPTGTVVVVAPSGYTFNPATSLTLTSISVGATVLATSITCSAPCNLGDSAGRAKAAEAIRAKIVAGTATSGYTAVAIGGAVTITATTEGPAKNGTVSAVLGANPIHLDLTPAPEVTGGKTMTMLPVSLAAFSGGANAAGTISAITEPFSGGGSTGGYNRMNVGEFKRCDITTTADCVGLGAGKFPKAVARTDCTNATFCTYAEESTNFANWYAYYRTRMQSMKTAVSLAFADIGDIYRVGFVNIQGGSFLKVADFGATQKASWYNKLFNEAVANATPLRSALARVGQMYAHKGPFAADDPMQYSCQQNFALLTTDGYWNQDNCSDVKKLDNTTSVGNQDNLSTLGVSNPAMWDGYSTAVGTCLGSSGGPGTVQTLSDVAYYYANTDLRTQALGNCTNGVFGAAQDLCARNNVRRAKANEPPYQNMVSFTLGLGVSGTLRYQPDYEDAASGDFACIKSKGAGADCSAANSKWPTVSPGGQTTVDDLWHAAVNGYGKYFSAADPASLKGNLDDALNAIKSSVGTGAAAATSAQALSKNDINYAYVASYTTVEWTGNLEARVIDKTTGVVSPAAAWCVSDITAQSGTGAVNCSGKLKDQITPDTRKIYIRDATATGGAAKLKQFYWTPPPGVTGLNATEKTYFDPCPSSGPVTALSQCGGLPAATKTAATGDTLVNYLRGQNNFEMGRSTNVYQAYRNRSGPMGDAVGSQPTYTGIPDLTYTDPFYSDYVASKTPTASQPKKTVYIGGNDGFLHAFSGDPVDGGSELWAYIPTSLLPKLRVLADENYSLPNQHRYFVNGSPVAADVCKSNPCASVGDWRTIVVTGLAAGGRAWFALDVTDPLNPISLWEFSDANDGDVGYAFGSPVVTKRPDGRWVVLLTSGYNNASGHGVLFVLDAVTGELLTRISNRSGSAANPSGLAKIQPFLTDGAKDNTARDIYGGDMNGNVWRFRLDVGNESVVKIAQLADDTVTLGKPQPVTTTPITTTLADGFQTRYLIVATGSLIQAADMSDTSKQSLYAFSETYDLLCSRDPEPVAANKCDAAPKGLVIDINGTRGSSSEVPATYATVGNCARGNTSTPPMPTLCPHGARDQLYGTTLVTDGQNEQGYYIRKTDSTVIAPTKAPTVAGCYVDFPDTGERTNVDPIIISGKVVLVTNVPESAACSTGGRSFQNIFDYRTCKAVESLELGSALAVGVTAVTTVDGMVKPLVTLADNPTPKTLPGFNPSITTFQGDRKGWRLLND